MERIVIVGFGDIGQRIARDVIAEGGQVTALSRSFLENPSTLADIDGVGLDLDREIDLSAVPLAGSRLIYTAPPPARGAGDPRATRFGAALTRENRPAVMVYLSTSGVYGDCRGEWVTEARPVNPQTDRSKRRLAAETAFRQRGQELGIPVVILRVAGIYGPGRLPLERLERGMTVLAKAEAPYSNRIHADDLAAICLAAARRAKDGDIYNACDGEETTMTDYFTTLARVFSLPEPACISRQEAESTMSREMLSYLGESRRLDNSRLARLGVRLRYPTLEAGLQAIRDNIES